MIITYVLSGLCANLYFTEICFKIELILVLVSFICNRVDLEALFSSCSCNLI